MRPRQKRNFEGSGAIDRRKLAATFVNMGGAVRMESFALGVVKRIPKKYRA
jgi:hypothetical protein